MEYSQKEELRGISPRNGIDSSHSAAGFMAAFAFKALIRSGKVVISDRSTTCIRFSNGYTAAGCVWSAVPRSDPL